MTKCNKSAIIPPEANENEPTTKEDTTMTMKELFKKIEAYNEIAHMMGTDKEIGRASCRERV